MKKKIELTEEQAANLEKLIDYVCESEAKDFEEHCFNGGKKENHIYWTALLLKLGAAFGLNEYLLELKAPVVKKVKNENKFKT